MTIASLRQLLSTSSPGKTRLILDRDEGTAHLVTESTEVKDEVVRRLPGRRQDVFRLQRRGRHAWVVTARIDRFGRALRQLNWGQEDPPSPPRSRGKRSRGRRSRGQRRTRPAPRRGTSADRQSSSRSRREEDRRKKDQRRKEESG